MAILNGEIKIETLTVLFRSAEIDNQILNHVQLFESFEMWDENYLLLVFFMYELENISHFAEGCVVRYDPSSH